MSDGASRLVTEYQIATWAEVFTALRSGGPAELIDTVRKVEATDPTGIRWPRYKSGDDAAVALSRGVGGWGDGKLTPVPSWVPGPVRPTPHSRESLTISVRPMTPHHIPSH
jgi:hypothetical protein